MPARTVRLLWATALIILIIATCASLCFPVRRMFTTTQINYNEGWNAYRVSMLRAGEQLYAAPPRYTNTNYPPLSFHMIALLTRITGDPVLTGRCVALISLFAVSALTAAIVWQVIASLAGAAYAGLGILVSIALFTPDRVGMDDPQLLAMALMMTGLLAYLRKPESVLALSFSAIVFAVALFTKHSLLTFPAALGIALLLSGAQRQFLLWTATFVTAIALLFAATILIDGPFFWTHLSTARAFSLLEGWSRSSWYLWIFETPLAGAVLWAIWTPRTPPRLLFILAFVVAHAVAFALIGRNGIDYNHFFDGMVAMVIMVSIALVELVPLLGTTRVAAPLFAAALALPFVGLFTIAPPRLYSDWKHTAALSTEEDNAERAVEFLESHAGPALCEDLLYCFKAGKPYLFEPHFLYNQVKTGRIPEKLVLDLLRSRQFSAIEVAVSPREPLAPVEHTRFSAEFMRTLLEYYRPALTTETYTILVPV